MVLSGAFALGMGLVQGGISNRSVPSLLTTWLLVAALSSALIILIASVILQKTAEPFSLREAAGAAAAMSLFTAALFLGSAADKWELNLEVVLVSLIGGAVVGFVGWLLAFVLFPRLVG